MPAACFFVLKMKIKDILFLGGLILLAAVSFDFGYKYGKKAAILPVETRADTLVVRDTIREILPVYKDRTITRTEWVQVSDTIHHHDTLFVALDFERKVYESEDYRAVVEGYRPVLSEIAVYPKTTYITTKETEIRRWSAGITIGPGILYDGIGLHGGIGIVAGLQYNF